MGEPHEASRTDDAEDNIYDTATAVPAVKRLLPVMQSPGQRSKVVFISFALCQSRWHSLARPLSYELGQFHIFTLSTRIHEIVADHSDREVMQPIRVRQPVDWRLDPGMPYPVRSRRCSLSQGGIADSGQNCQTERKCMD